jgi:putative transposase
MTSQSPGYHGYRFPPEIISHAVWLYHRFCLSFRDAEDLLAQRGVTVTYETIRQWCRTFGPAYARTLRRHRGHMGDMWYLDELFITIHGRQQYLWRAVDEDGDMIDILVQSRRDRHAATRFFPEVAETPGVCISTSHHGQAAELCVGSSGRDAVRGPCHGPVREQSS